MNIDWNTLPYDHKSWAKDQVSIMNPAAKITWPQFIAEMVIWNRSRIMDEYKLKTLEVGWRMGHFRYWYGNGHYSSSGSLGEDKNKDYLPELEAMIKHDGNLAR